MKNPVSFLEKDLIVKNDEEEGNPWHGEDGRFTSGPSVLKDLVPEKSSKDYFNKEEVIEYVGADGFKYNTSLKTKQLDALKTMHIASMSFQSIFGENPKKAKTIRDYIAKAAANFKIATINKIRKSSEKFYAVQGSNYLGNFRKGERAYLRAMKLLQREIMGVKRKRRSKKYRPLSQEEKSRYSKYLNQMGTIVNTFKYIEKNSPTRRRDIAKSLHREKFN